MGTGTIMVVKFSTAVLILLPCWPLASAREPEQQQENASTRLVITRPDEGGVFVNVLRSLRELKDSDHPFEWKAVDEKIDKWFTEAETRFPEDFKNNAGKWDTLREQTKRDARVALTPVEDAWKDSVNLTASKFVTSEMDFYDRKPTLLISGTYRYFEGNRDRSSVKPSWDLDDAKLINAAGIEGEDTYDTGKIILNAAGINRPMFSLKCVWTLSLKASIDPDSLDVRAIGAVNTPEISAWITPRFTGESNRKITLTWGNFDKTTTPIGPVKLFIGDTEISTSLGLGTGFTYEALDTQAPDPTLHAGVRDPALID
jgi:hypothetical protein